MNKVGEILMKRDGNTKEQAESRLCYDCLANGSYNRKR